jgi:hypothetical protein
MNTIDSRNRNKLACRISAALGVLFLCQVSPAQVTIQVISRPKLEVVVQCARPGADCVVQGSLQDDMGLPIPNQELLAAVESPETPDESLGSRLRPCTEYENVEHTNTNQATVTRTNDSGKFCLRAVAGALPADAKVSVKYPGGTGYEPAFADIALSQGGPSASLNVLTASDKIAVESASVTIAVQLSAPGRVVAGQPISLLLADQSSRETKNKETILATATTDADGIARFAVTGARFGTPGPALLIARYAGSPDVPTASASWPTMRTCKVEVQTHVQSDTTEVGDFVEITSTATTACNATPEGSIDFFVDRNVQVTLPLKRGRATWKLSTFRFAPGDIAIGSRYAATSAAWTAHGISYATLHLQPISGRRRAFWLGSGCLVLAWFAVRWHRGYARPKALPKRTTVLPQSLEVEPSRSPESGWTGIVIDSHTGTSIADATVSVVTPGFAGKHTEIAVKSSDNGAFQLEHRELLPRAQLVVQAPRYLQAQWAMPSAGRLVIRLETRRRAIVRTFVRWAGKLPSAQDPEPTPAQVAQSARKQSNSEVHAWASRVEVAAFGPDEPQARDEALLSPPEQASASPKQSQ